MDKPFHKHAAEALKEAWDMFGTYSYGDKGAHEVMDVDALTTELKKLPIPEIISELKKLSEMKLHKHADAGPLLAALLGSMDSDPNFDALFEDDFIQEHY